MKKRYCLKFGALAMVLCMVATLFVGCNSGEQLKLSKFLVKEAQAQSSLTIFLTTSQQMTFGVKEFDVPDGLARCKIQSDEYNLVYFFAGNFERVEMFGYAETQASKIQNKIGTIWFNTSAGFAEREYSLKEKTNKNSYVLTKLIDSLTGEEKEVYNLTIFYEIFNGTNYAKVSFTLIDEPVTIDNKYYSTPGVLVAFGTEPTLDIPQTFPEDALDDITLTQLTESLFVEEPDFQVPQLDVEEYTLKEKSSTRLAVEFEMSETDFAALKNSFATKYTIAEEDLNFDAITMQESFLHHDKNLCVMACASYEAGVVTYSIENWYEFPTLVLPASQTINYTNVGGESSFVCEDNVVTFTSQGGSKTKFEYNATTGLFVKYTKATGEELWTAGSALYTQRLMLNEMLYQTYHEFLSVEDDLSFRLFNTNDNVVAGRECLVYRKIVVQDGTQYQWRVLICDGIVMKVTCSDGNGTQVLFEII